MAKEKDGRRKHRARGGSAEHDRNPKMHVYNANLSEDAKSGMGDKDDGFKRGGHVKRKRGGHVTGEHERKHLGKPGRRRGGHVAREHERHGEEHRVEREAEDRRDERRGEDHRVERNRGGHVPKRARGGSPYSSAHSLAGPGDKGEQGHEDESVPKEVP